ncbi:TMEM165/GDT1 family protein [Dechloromonas sp. HYN0024]|uniref:TMEM165/GDT1 family protein n=1 Tax=Dechloromonas sp. HYN0024 TaxID=2231055 RepID=UPI000E44FB06|nr:TMEM165/GDT1 family protein [Dechloromonas sp. HYN0024]AXS80552.1 UPF0016 domain-containing protein [Dechloromonas sp. HYN0024]
MTELGALTPGAWLSSAGTTFLLIGLAEFGDKSQLVCMTLAARHRGLPVVLGAVAAFALLNLLAVLFGAAIAAWLPEWVVTSAVALLFAYFGVSALRFEEAEEDEDIPEKPGHNIVATTFLMIFLAEFGDKTQIAVAGLGGTADATATWVGATLALACTSILGVVAGRRWLNRLPLHWIHRVSGVFFLLLALLATLRLIGII